MGTKYFRSKEEIINCTSCKDNKIYDFTKFKKGYLEIKDT